MEKDLAINGGNHVFPETFGFEPWPPVKASTGDKLRELYLSHNWSYYGPQELALCEEFAAYHDAEYGTFMANGTTTLECALRALEIGPGDEVIVPSWTWIATGFAPIYCGAVPVFVDVQPDTFCLDPKAFEVAITPRTKAVIPVHLFGSMADIDEIVAIAHKHGLAVIEDCAHAHGGKYSGRGLGSFGDVGSFSFQQSKIMTSGEGGLCLTSNHQLYDRINRLKHIGSPVRSKRGETVPPLEMGLICRNYRATEFQALILRDQLQDLKKDTAYRADNAAYLRSQLEKIPGLGTQAPGHKATEQSYYVFGITVDPAVLKPGKTRNDVIAAVTAEGAPEVFAGWGAPVFKHRIWNVEPERYRVASSSVAEEIITNRVVLCGIQWLMSTKKELDWLVEAFVKVMKEYSK